VTERLFETDDESLIITSVSSGRIEGKPHRRLKIRIGLDFIELRTWEQICGLLGALHFARHSYAVELHTSDGWPVIFPQLTQAQFEQLDARAMTWARTEKERRGL
jgi:hypothetical protein